MFTYLSPVGKRDLGAAKKFLSERVVDSNTISRQFAEGYDWNTLAFYRLDQESRRKNKCRAAKLLDFWISRPHSRRRRKGFGSGLDQDDFRWRMSAPLLTAKDVAGIHVTR